MVKIFCDSADLKQMLAMRSCVQGYTTNPALMRKAGVTDYRAFAHEVVAAIPDLPVSFEVFADEMNEMERQAREIASWGENVYVKIPVTNTLGESTAQLINTLSGDGVKLNVTAIFTFAQIETVARSLYAATPAIMSIFAGRIADTGTCPDPFFIKARHVKRAQTEILWASTRELYNIREAENLCDIITVTPDMLAKMHLFKHDLAAYSLETVQMFFNDAQIAGYQL